MRQPILLLWAAVGAVLLIDAGLQLGVSLLPDAFGVAGRLALDGRVLAVTSAAALATSVLFGLLPALRASRVDLRRTLVEGGSPSIAGTARGWPRRAMVVIEVALGVVLLVGAGLLLRTFDGLMRLRPGFDGTHVTAATLSLQDARYQTADRVRQLFDQSLARIRGIAGVERAAVALTLPYERALNLGWRFAGGGQRQAVINLTYVTPDYFDVLRIPVVRGRGFAEADGPEAAPVAVVNQAFVRRHSPDADSVGRQIAMGGQVRTIVGIVGDIQQKVSFGSFGPVAPTPAAYVPAAQVAGDFFAMVHTWFSPSWVVRTTFDRPDLSAEMQQAVQAVDPRLLFNQFRTLDDVRGEAAASQRAQAALLGSLAALALLLAAVGLYALVAGSVAERTRELGIRIALGATPAQAARAAALPGVALGAAGVVLGLASARAGAGVMRSLVFGVSATDPLTFGLAAGAVLVVTCVAALVPSLRILRLDPVRALRTS